MEYLEEIASIYGIETEDILTLIDFGYDVFEIEEMLYFDDFRELVGEIRRATAFTFLKNNLCYFRLFFTAF